MFHFLIPSKSLIILKKVGTSFFARYRGQLETSDWQPHQVKSLFNSHKQNCYLKLPKLAQLFSLYFMIQGSAGLSNFSFLRCARSFPPIVVYQNRVSNCLFVGEILKYNNKIEFYHWGCCMYTVQTRSSLTPCSSLAPLAPGGTVSLFPKVMLVL